MTTNLEQDVRAAVEAANRAGSGGPLDEALGRLAEKVGAHANVKAVFGEPIERDGLLVVPVAKVRWGFGAGGGMGPMSMGAAGATAEAAPVGDETTAQGGGGGGGVTADPIGWLEIGPDGAEFKPIMPAMPSPAFLLAATLGGSLVLRALAKLLRR